MEKEIVNRVAMSPLITFDLADHYDHGTERAVIDVADRLWQGMVLREQEFRDWVKEQDWSAYTGKAVAVHCSTDAIVPVWAYMLLATRLEPFVSLLVFGDTKALETALFLRQLEKIDYAQFQDKKIVVKGCGEIDVPEAVYMEITRRLTPLADKIMYGEPCSTVPLYRKPKQ